MTSFLIFGASSGIGLKIIEILRETYDENELYITAILRPDSPNNKKVEELISLVTGEVLYIDVCNENLNLFALERIQVHDYCYLLAWNGSQISLRNDISTNKASRKCLLRVMGLLLDNDKVREGYIYTGSQAEYGDVEENVVTEDTKCSPKSAYGIEKYIFGQEAYRLCTDKGVSFYEYRLHSVFGKDVNKNGLIINLIKLMINNEPIEFNTDCNQITDYVYVDDCARALLIPAWGKLSSGVYNVSSANGKRLRWYIEKMRDSLNSKSTISYGNISEYDYDFVYDSAKLRKETGWSTSISFIEGILLIANAME